MVPSGETAFYQIMTSQRSDLPSSCRLEDNVKSRPSHLMGNVGGVDSFRVFFMPLSRPEGLGQEEKTHPVPRRSDQGSRHNLNLKDTLQPTGARRLGSYGWLEPGLGREDTPALYMNN